MQRKPLRDKTFGYLINQDYAGSDQEEGDIFSSQAISSSKD
jgi:hypothetical protein